MAGIKEPIQDILSKLTDLGYYARIWNNQIDHMKDGSSYVFQMPAIFVEIINDVSYEILGEGFRSADLGIRFHLAHELLNTEGSYEQDLEIFDLRDKIVREFTQYCPTNCGQMNCVREGQDPDHDNVYHYVMEYVCNFIDTKGSPYDEDNQKKIEQEFNITPKYVINGTN